jgi:hypothetical protein
LVAGDPLLTAREKLGSGGEGTFGDGLLEGDSGSDFAIGIGLLNMKPGTVVTVLGIEGEWYRVEFNDQYIGPRVGYVSRQNVSAVNAQLTPQDLSIVSGGNQLAPMDLSVPRSPETMEPVDLSIHDQKPKDKANEPIDLSIKLPK